MNGYFKINAYGNVASDIELKTTANGNSIARFSLAVNTDYRDKEGNKVERVNFYWMTAFGKRAEVLHQYVKKGQPLIIEATLKNNNYQKDGKTVYQDQIEVENFYFVGSQQPQQQAQPQQPQAQAYQPLQPQAQAYQPLQEDWDDSVPF